MLSCVHIAVQGVLHSKLLIGAFNRELYTEFLIELSETLAGSQFGFIMDNCRIHHGINLDCDEDQINFLPPYSPHLNIAETIWRKLKKEWLNPEDYLDKNALFYALNRCMANLGTILNIKYANFNIN